MPSVSSRICAGRAGTAIRPRPRAAPIRPGAPRAEGGAPPRARTHQVVLAAVRGGELLGRGPHPQALGARAVGGRHHEAARRRLQQLVEDEALALARAAAHGGHAHGAPDTPEDRQRIPADLELARVGVVVDELQRRSHLSACRKRRQRGGGRRSLRRRIGRALDRPAERRARRARAAARAGVKRAWGRLRAERRGGWCAARCAGAGQCAARLVRRLARAVLRARPAFDSTFR
jgi:hypothetical protein